jgi:hypothetical protein
MAKINNNPLLKGLSGMFGDVVVYSERRGKMIMSNRPKKREESTDHQKLVKSKFLQAVQYAKGQMKNDSAKAEYAAAVNDKLMSAYAVAVADYLKGPEIIAVNTKAYNGHVGDVIEVLAIDNFKVTEIIVEIRSASDQLIEEGPAMITVDNTLNWRYTTAQENAESVGTRLIIRAKDKPGTSPKKSIRCQSFPKLKEQSPTG